VVMPYCTRRGHDNAGQGPALRLCRECRALPGTGFIRDQKYARMPKATPRPGSGE
jgi:hypothetical protein